MKNTQHSDTENKITLAAMHLVSRNGCNSLSMRDLAKEIPISASVLYFYFSDKDDLLLKMYLKANQLLGEARSQLVLLNSTEERFRQLVEFQLQNAELVVTVLRYYLYKRELFHAEGTGTLPEKATLHVEEILEFGIQRGDIHVEDLKTEAKVIVHAINGYLLEYFPYMPKGKEANSLIDGIVKFIMRSLQNAPNTVVGRTNKKKGIYVH